MTKKQEELPKAQFAGAFKLGRRYLPRIFGPQTPFDIYGTTNILKGGVTGIGSVSFPEGSRILSLPANEALYPINRSSFFNRPNAPLAVQDIRRAMETYEPPMTLENWQHRLKTFQPITDELNYNLPLINRGGLNSLIDSKGLINTNSLNQFINKTKGVNENDLYDRSKLKIAYNNLGLDNKKFTTLNELNTELKNNVLFIDNTFDIVSRIEGTPDPRLQTYWIDGKPDDFTFENSTILKTFIDVNKLQNNIYKKDISFPLLDFYKGVGHSHFRPSTSLAGNGLMLGHSRLYFPTNFPNTTQVVEVQSDLAQKANKTANAEIKKNDRILQDDLVYSNARQNTERTLNYFQNNLNKSDDEISSFLLDEGADHFLSRHITIDLNRFANFFNRIGKNALGDGRKSTYLSTVDFFNDVSISDMTTGIQTNMFDEGYEQGLEKYIKTHPEGFTNEEMLSLYENYRLATPIGTERMEGWPTLEFDKSVQASKDPLVNKFFKLKLEFDILNDQAFIEKQITEKKIAADDNILLLNRKKYPDALDNIVNEFSKNSGAIQLNEIIDYSLKVGNNTIQIPLPSTVADIQGYMSSPDRQPNPLYTQHQWTGHNTNQFQEEISTVINKLGAGEKVDGLNYYELGDGISIETSSYGTPYIQTMYDVGGGGVSSREIDFGKSRNFFVKYNNKTDQYVLSQDYDQLRRGPESPDIEHLSMDQVDFSRLSESDRKDYLDGLAKTLAFKRNEFLRARGYDPMSTEATDIRGLRKEHQTIVGKYDEKVIVKNLDQIFGKNYPYEIIEIDGKPFLQFKFDKDTPRNPVKGKDTYQKGGQTDEDQNDVLGIRALLQALKGSGAAFGKTFSKFLPLANMFTSLEAGRGSTLEDLHFSNQLPDVVEMDKDDMQVYEILLGKKVPEQGLLFTSPEFDEFAKALVLAHRADSIINSIPLQEYGGQTPWLSLDDSPDRDYKKGGEYKRTSISKYENGGEPNYYQMLIQFIKEQEAGMEYMKAKNSAVLKPDGKTYYKRYEDGKFYPYYHQNTDGSFESEATIGYGTKGFNIYDQYKSGMSVPEANIELNKSLENAHRKTKIFVDANYGEGFYDNLSDQKKVMLADFTYNLGRLSKYPSFAKGILTDDTDLALKEYIRGEQKGGAKLARNDAYLETFLQPWVDQTIARKEKEKKEKIQKERDAIMQEKYSSWYSPFVPNSIENLFKQNYDWEEQYFKDKGITTYKKGGSTADDPYERFGGYDAYSDMLNFLSYQNYLKAGNKDMVDVYNKMYNFDDLSYSQMYRKARNIYNVAIENPNDPISQRLIGRMVDELGRPEFIYKGEVYNPYSYEEIPTQKLKDFERDLNARLTAIYQNPDKQNNAYTRSIDPVTGLYTYAPSTYDPNTPSSFLGIKSPSEDLFLKPGDLENYILNYFPEGSKERAFLDANPDAFAPIINKYELFRPELVSLNTFDINNVTTKPVVQGTDQYKSVIGPDNRSDYQRKVDQRRMEEMKLKQDLANIYKYNTNFSLGLPNMSQNFSYIDQIANDPTISYDQMNQTLRGNLPSLNMSVYAGLASNPAARILKGLQTPLSRFAPRVFNPNVARPATIGDALNVGFGTYGTATYGPSMFQNIRKGEYGDAALDLGNIALYNLGAPRSLGVFNRGMTFGKIYPGQLTPSVLPQINITPSTLNAFRTKYPNLNLTVSPERYQQFAGFSQQLPNYSLLNPIRTTFPSTQNIIGTPSLTQRGFDNIFRLQNQGGIFIPRIK